MTSPYYRRMSREWREFMRLRAIRIEEIRRLMQMYGLTLDDLK